MLNGASAVLPPGGQLYSAHQNSSDAAVLEIMAISLSSLKPTSDKMVLTV